MSFLSSCPIRSNLLFFATALSKERLKNSPRVTAIERAVSAAVEKKNEREDNPPFFFPRFAKRAQRRESALFASYYLSGLWQLFS